MNKQELIDKLKKQLTTPSVIKGSDFDCGHNYGIEPVVPQYVADFYESIKDDFENKVYELCLQYKHRGDELPQGVAWWFGDSRNKPIETLVMMHKFGYEVKKEKLYRAKNRHTGEYLCYCFEFFHDKNSSSENQRVTAEEKRWKELGYWGNDLYVFEEAEGEDE